MKNKLLLVLLDFALAMADFTSNCPSECSCFWANGNKAANCSNAHLSGIPKTFSTEIQDLVLDGNHLHNITRHAFSDVGLINIKKLSLRECELSTIEKDGFDDLSLMIELKLSKNNISMLHADMFKDTLKIRWIYLSDNKIEILEDGLFNDLQFLQKVDLSNNRIVTIGLKTFMNVPRLNYLRLDGNMLGHLKVDTLSALTSLTSIDVYDNPWRCDCSLQPLRNWVISKNPSASSVSCAGPPALQGKLWKDLDSDDFACTPSDSNVSKVSLSCQVNGSPLPELNLALNTQFLNGTQKEIIYFITQTSSSDNRKWVNITVVFNN